MGNLEGNGFNQPQSALEKMLESEPLINESLNLESMIQKVDKKDSSSKFKINFKDLKKS